MRDSRHRRGKDMTGSMLPEMTRGGRQQWGVYIFCDPNSIEVFMDTQFGRHQTSGFSSNVLNPVEWLARKEHGDII